MCLYSTSGQPPTEAGYLEFIRTIMRIPVEALPDDSPAIHCSFCSAQTLVNCTLMIVGNACPDQPSYYAWAVYNLAGDMLVNYAPDNDNAQPPVEPPNDHYFTILRQSMGLATFVPGLIQSSSDEGTSQSFMVPGWMEQMTLANLQQLKTPWGRQYLMLAQAYGPTIWGIS
jgi:hypothetical protein